MPNCSCGRPATAQLKYSTRPFSKERNSTFVCNTCKDDVLFKILKKSEFCDEYDAAGNYVVSHSMYV